MAAKKGQMPNNPEIQRGHETSEARKQAEQARQQAQAQQAENAQPSSRERMVEVGRGTQQAGRQ